MKKSVVLMVVMGVMFTIVSFSLVALFLMTQEGRIAAHKVKRMRAYYAARAALISAYGELRTTGSVATDPVVIGAGVGGYPAGGYSVDITTTFNSAEPYGAPLNGVTQVEANITY